MSNHQYTRRTALQLLGGFGAAAALAPWQHHHDAPAPAPFACFVSDTGPCGAGLYVSRHGEAARQPISFAPVHAPSALAVAADQDLVIVASSAPLAHLLPAGSLRSYSLSRKGALSLVNSRSLSLSATGPLAVALSLCHTRVAVLAANHTVYNVFSMHPDGTLGELQAVHKDLRTPNTAPARHTAQKPQLAFLANGTLQRRTSTESLPVTYELRDGTLRPLLHGLG